MALGVAVLVTNAFAAGWGATCWLRKAPRMSIGFWPLLRVAQVAVVVQVVLGLLLLARGDRAHDDLHVLYGIAPLVVTLVSEGMRVGVAQRELEGVEDPEALDHAKQVAIARRVALGEVGVMTTGFLGTPVTVRS